jgi:hypothetical protein
MQPWTTSKQALVWGGSEARRKEGKKAPPKFLCLPSSATLPGIALSLFLHAFLACTFCLCLC